jgi:hypothetical protein
LIVGSLIPLPSGHGVFGVQNQAICKPQ